jgi:hypothetical protein
MTQFLDCWIFSAGEGSIGKMVTGIEYIYCLFLLFLPKASNGFSFVDRESQMCSFKINIYFFNFEIYLFY